MKNSLLLGMVLLFSAACPAFSQGGASVPDPTGKGTMSANAALIAARAATKEKRYADSEALMLKLTATSPEMILSWVELGLAQMGLKKYPEAEQSFKVALGIDPASLRKSHSGDFYQAPDTKGVVAPSATRTSADTLGETVSTAENRTPEIKGVSYASLGEVYIRTGKIAEAKAAFDSAVSALPAQAALYRRNETIFFFQTGNSDAQLAAAEQAIAVDPSRAMLYYFKGQAMVSKATVDPQTQKMILPPGCAEAYQKYLDLEPNGQFANEAKGVLTGAGLPLKAATSKHI